MCNIFYCNIILDNLKEGKDQRCEREDEAIKRKKIRIRKKLEEEEAKKKSLHESFNLR